MSATVGLSDPQTQILRITGQYPTTMNIETIVDNGRRKTDPQRNSTTAQAYHHATNQSQTTWNQLRDENTEGRRTTVRRSGHRRTTKATNLGIEIW